MSDRLTASREQAGTKSSVRERGLDRVVQLLNFLHEHRQPIRIGQLARSLDAPRSSIYELVRVLTEAGLLENVGDDGRIFFGKTMYLYGMDYMHENDLVRRGREEVDRLARDTGETGELCMLQNDKYTIIHTCPGLRPFRISTAVGIQIPIPWTASGRLLLSHLSRQEVEELIPREDFALPDGRVIELDEFMDAITEAARRGYCITTGLVDAYTKCLAVPIYEPRGRVDATICLVVPKETPPKRTDKLLRRLIESGRKLSTAREFAL